MTFLQYWRTCSRRADAEQVVGNAAADAELLAQHAMGLEDVALVHVIDDALLRQLGERLQVAVPLALGIEQRLAAVGPKLLDDRLDGRPIDVLKDLGRDEGDAAAVHPVADGHQPVRDRRCSAPTWYRCGISASQAATTLSRRSNRSSTSPR